MSLISLEADWEYQSTLNEVPVDLYAVSVPTSGWVLGTSPFGDGPVPTGLTAINTTWTKNTGLWIRRFVICDGEKDVLVKGNCEQALYVFWNGDFIGSLNPTNSARTDVPEYRIIIDRTLAISGTHEIAILCLDDDNVLGTSLCYVSIEADYLPVVFPFQPEVPVIERLSWVTDVNMSRNGTEERKKISGSPRQEFKLRYPAGYEKKPEAQNILWGDLESEILIPVWTQGVRVSSISAGLFVLTLDTTNSEFRAPGFAMIWSSDQRWQIVGINQVNSNSLLICNPTEAFSVCWIMPVRIGVLAKGATKITNGYSSVFELDLMVRDNKELTVSAPTQYLSDDLYTDETLLSGDTISEEFKIDLEVFDPGIGEFSFNTGLERTRSYREFRVLCEDADSSWAFRQFLHRRSGRYRQFRQPSFENDLRVENTGLITNLLQVKKDEYMRSSQSRDTIAIQISSGWLLRQITDVSSVDSDTMALQLSSNINVTKQDIRRISWLGIKRLDTDVIEINHIGAGVSQSSFVVTEIAS